MAGAGNGYARSVDGRNTHTRMTLLDATLRAAKHLLPERLKWKIKVALGVPDMEASLIKLRRNGFRPRKVVDVGAYTGEWTQMCRRLFPDARVLMVEPQSRLREGLRERLASDPHLQFSPALLGARAQAAVPFYEADSASSIFAESEPSTCATATLPMTTLDEITRGSEFSSPDFIKLDVQGAELAVLEGGDHAVRSAEAILMEVNLLEIYAGVPLLDRTVAFMAERGFRVYDICTFFRRPLDNALWQADMIFIRSSSPLLASKSWGKHPT
jgi:FkbM family methyltransferase